MKWLRTLVVCPSCKGPLLSSPKRLLCSICREEFPQDSDVFVDLMPADFAVEQGAGWEDRLRAMEKWYRELIVSSESAAAALACDYAPHVSYLGTLSGAILDVGGGVGLVRHYVKDPTRYVVVDPSVDWLRREWTSLTPWFPCLSTVPVFVRGVAERLPFPAGMFDAVLSFWSLNHAADPKAVFAESARVLVPGGRLYIVLEDMLPQWRDIFSYRFPLEEVWAAASGSHGTDSTKIGTWLRLIRKRLGSNEWPLQPDHLRIMEGDIRRWARGRLDVRQRAWRRQFLTLEFEKLSLLARS